MLRKHKDQSIVDFVFEDKLADAKKEKEIESKVIELLDKRIAEDNKAKNLSNKDNGYKTTKHISSTGRGSKPEVIQPPKYLKSETADSIWGPKQTPVIKKENASENEIDETIRIEQRLADKKEADGKRMSNLPIKNDRSLKVSLGPKKEGYDYRVSGKGLGIFDTDKFERIPEKTAGEKLSEETEKKQAEKDESWKKRGKALSSKDLNKKFIDRLLEEKE